MQPSCLPSTLLRNPIVVVVSGARRRSFPGGTTMELFPAFEHAVASTAKIVKGTPAGQMDAPTPCTEWDVRALLNNVIGTLWLAGGLFGEHAPGHPVAAGG